MAAAAEIAVAVIASGNTVIPVRADAGGMAPKGGIAVPAVELECKVTFRVISSFFC